MKLLNRSNVILYFIGLVSIDIAFSINIDYNINYDLNIVNNYFYINYDDNYIILNSYDTPYVKINFEYIAEIDNNEEYKKTNILFNTFIKDNEYIKTIMKNKKLYFEMNYDTFYNNNYVDVFMFMKEQNKTKYGANINNIVICISFDKENINYDGKYTLELKDYVINFSNISFSDGKYNKVNVERFGNYFYIYFPSYKDYMQYKFTIKYEHNYIYFDLV